MDQYLIYILNRSNQEARATARQLVEQARETMRTAHRLRDENQQLRKQMWDAYERCLRDMDKLRNTPPQS